MVVGGWLAWNETFGSVVHGENECSIKPTALLLRRWSESSDPRPWRYAVRRFLREMRLQCCGACRPSRCVASLRPPYWGLRDYGIEDQIGLETTLPQFIHRLVALFAEVRRVLSDDGTFWLNIGDGHTSGNRGWRAPDKKNPARAMDVRPDTPEGLKPKDLIGVPWQLAFALQADGWYLRSDVV